MMTKQTRLMIILGVNRQVDGKVDGAVEDEEEVGDLGHQVGHVGLQVLRPVFHSGDWKEKTKIYSVVWRSSLWFILMPACFQIDGLKIC